MKKGLMFLLLGLIFFGGNVSYAQGPKGQLRQAAKEIRQGDKKEAKQDLKCAALINRLNERHGILRAYKSKRILAYEKTVSRLEKIATNQKEKGKDVTTLENNIVKLKTKVEQVKTDYESFIKQLETARSLDCGDANGEFKKALQAAKELRESIRTQVKEIQNFIKTDIKNSLLALK